MAMNPYVLEIKPNEIDENWVLDDFVSSYFGTAKDVCEISSSQRERINNWVFECLKENHPDKHSQLMEDMLYTAIAFPVTIKDIKKFRQLMGKNWRRSELYSNREEYYDSYIIDLKFYLKVRLALRAGKTVVIQWL